MKGEEKKQHGGIKGWEGNVRQGGRRKKEKKNAEKRKKKNKRRKLKRYC